MLRTLAIVLLAIGSAACSSSSIEDDGGSGGSAGEGGGGTGGADAGGGGTGEVLDLFVCGVPRDCVQDFGHLGEGSTEEDARCAGELVTSGESGALLTKSQPGPEPMETETLYVLDGDGGVFVQTRSRCSTEDGCSWLTSEWSRSVLQRCTVDVPAEDVAGCDTEEGVCTWYGRTTACEPVAETWTCSEL